LKKRQIFQLIHGESLQVLHYFFPDSKVDPTKGGQEVFTLLIYLNDVDEGGETIFPKIDLKVLPKGSRTLFSLW